MTAQLLEMDFFLPLSRDTNTFSDFSYKQNSPPIHHAKVSKYTKFYKNQSQTNENIGPKNLPSIFLYNYYKEIYFGRQEASGSFRAKDGKEQLIAARAHVLSIDCILLDILKRVTTPGPPGIRLISL